MGTLLLKGGREEGGGVTQSEINNSTLIHHKPSLQRDPLWLQHSTASECRVGGRLLLSMSMKCLGISIFRLALHSISISFRSFFRFISIFRFISSGVMDFMLQRGRPAWVSAQVSCESEGLDQHAWLLCSCYVLKMHKRGS